MKIEFDDSVITFFFGAVLILALMVLAFRGCESDQNFRLEQKKQEQKQKP